MLDTFRVPVRALSLVAIAVILFVLVGYLPDRAASPGNQQEKYLAWFLIASAVQISIFALWLFRPPGSMHSPYDPKAQALADYLKADQAQSVWLNATNGSSMYIHANLMRNGIALPNVYYGDMGQTVPVNGPFCGYSFDHILYPSSKIGKSLELVNDVSHQKLGEIPLSDLEYVGQFALDMGTYNIYHVTCEP